MKKWLVKYMNRQKKQDLGNILIIFSLFIPILFLKISKIFNFYFSGISAIGVLFSCIYIFLYKKEIKSEISQKKYLVIIILYFLSNINYLLHFEVSLKYIVINNIHLISWLMIPYFMGLNFEENLKFRNKIKILYTIFLLIFIREIIVASKIKYYRMFDDSNTLLMTQFYNFITVYLYMGIKKKKMSLIFLLINIFFSLLIGTKGIVLSSIIILSINFYLGLKRNGKLVIILFGAIIYTITFIFRIKILNYIHNFEYNFGLWRYKEFLIIIYKKIFFIFEKYEKLDEGRSLILEKWFREYNYKYFFGNPYYYNLEKGDYIHQAILDITYRFGLIIGVLFTILLVYVIYIFINNALKNETNAIILTTVTLILMGVFSSSITYNSYFWFGIGVIIKNKNLDVSIK